jgi:hypothetical protein
MDYTIFYMVCSELRLKEDKTPYMRERFGSMSEAIEKAKIWAAKSEHGGVYSVYECRLLGGAQKDSPPVNWKPYRWHGV